MKRIQLFFLFIIIFLTSATAQQQSGTPRPGEGITTFLERHGRPSRTYYREFLELNQSRLRGSKELRIGQRYLLPPLRGTNSAAPPAAGTPVKSVRQPLFGKRLAEVKPTGTRLQGACFYVVSGHGGPDPGAIGKVGRHRLHEDEYAYDVALRLARQLLLEGAQVHIIIQDAKDGIRDDAYLNNSKRETCLGKPIPLNQVERLKQRSDAVSALYSQDRRRYQYCRAIFLHVDSRSRGAQTDVYFYHAPQSTRGERLARTMKRTFEQKYDRHQPNRGFRGTVSSRGLYVLQHSTPVCLFVELGNIQNSFDQQRFVKSTNREALARWLKDGFIADYQKH